MIWWFFRMYSPILIIFLSLLFDKRETGKSLLVVFLPSFRSFWVRTILTGQMNQIELDGVNRLYGIRAGLRNHALMMFIFVVLACTFSRAKTQRKSSLTVLSNYRHLPLSHPYTRNTHYFWRICLGLLASHKKTLPLGAMSCRDWPSCLTLLLATFFELSRIFFFAEDFPKNRSLVLGVDDLDCGLPHGRLPGSFPSRDLGSGFGYHWILPGSMQWLCFVQGGFVAHNDMLRILYQMDPSDCCFLLMIHQIVKHLRVQKNATEKPCVMQVPSSSHCSGHCDQQYSATE